MKFVELHKTYRIGDLDIKYIGIINGGIYLITESSDCFKYVLDQDHRKFQLLPSGKLEIEVNYLRYSRSLSEIIPRDEWEWEEDDSDYIPYFDEWPDDFTSDEWVYATQMGPVLLNDESVLTEFNDDVKFRLTDVERDSGIVEYLTHWLHPLDMPKTLTPFEQTASYDKCLTRCALTPLIKLRLKHFDDGCIEGMKVGPITDEDFTKLLEKLLDDGMVPSAT